MLFACTFFNSSNLKASTLDTVSLKQNKNAIIYVTSGTEIYGTAYISNAKVLKIKNAVTPKKVVKTKTKFASIKEQFVSKNNQKVNELKILQDKIDKKIKNYFYSTSQNNDLARLAKLRFSNSAINTNFSFNFSGSLHSSNYILSVFKTKNTKRKFQTSLSFLEFGKLSDSFLRGPPNKMG